MISYAHYDTQLPKTHLADHIELSILPGYYYARAKQETGKTAIGDLRECLTPELRKLALFSSRYLFHHCS
jgi:hypothetical protein